MDLHKSKKTFMSISLLIIFIAGFFSVGECSQLQSIEQKQKVTSQKIQQLKLKEAKEKNKLVKNQQRLENASASLEASQAKYNSANAQLVTMEYSLSAAVADFNKKNTDMRNRIRQVYKNQRTGMFQLIFSARDLNSLLDIVYFEKIVLKLDYQRMMAVKSKSQNIAKMKNDIESRKRNLAQSIDSINSQKKIIKGEITKNQNMIGKLKNDRAYYEKTERELARQSNSIQSMINKNRGGEQVVISSTGFIKPIGGKISSPFGWRTHPIFHSRTFHSGIDIAGPNAGSIRASNSGKVIFSGWYGGYGKVVILDHGQVNGTPITTLYAHLSTIKVSNGQFVNKGDVVGLEGTTGYSTGPHCHFEVRVDGKPNNPLNYI